MATAKQFQGSERREESLERTARETHAAGASAVHRCRFERAQDRLEAAERVLPTTTRVIPMHARVGAARSELHVIQSQLRLRGLLE